MNKSENKVISIEESKESLFRAIKGQVLLSIEDCTQKGYQGSSDSYIISENGKDSIENSKIDVINLPHICAPSIEITNYRVFPVDSSPASDDDFEEYVKNGRMQDLERFTTEYQQRIIRSFRFAHVKHSMFDHLKAKRKEVGRVYYGDDSPSDHYISKYNLLNDKGKLFMYAEDLERIYKSIVLLETPFEDLWGKTILETHRKVKERLEKLEEKIDFK
ncbi:MAG: hypothetical protein UR15_C0040G0002 [Parcubacteria group bacterium GW2011_GWA2_31_28]|nr:MAG: hypothetical protein UR15_C0040G0002 [Parcubacteria group bacterium GW2011_GWA2_31_28]